MTEDISNLAQDQYMKVKGHQANSVKTTARSFAINFSKIDDNDN